MDEKKIEEYIKVVEQLIDKYVVSVLRKKAFEIFFEKYGDRYFTCPASSRTSYHEAYPGGLVEHSLIVLKYINLLVKAFDVKDKYSKEVLVTVALLHDVGKIGDSKNDYYVPEESDWHREKLGKMYDTSKKCQQSHHSRRSLFILQDCGFKLTEEEFESILYHDGQSLQNNNDINLKEYDLTLFLNWADRFSIQYKINKEKE